MWRSAKLIGFCTLVSSCTGDIPEHSDLLGATTRNELREIFGEPDRIRSGKYQPDVIGPNDPPLLYTEFAYWEYVSTNDGSLGRTYFSFYFDSEETVELLGDWNWIGVEEQRSVIQ